MEIIPAHLSLLFCKEVVCKVQVFLLIYLRNGHHRSTVVEWMLRGDKHFHLTARENEVDIAHELHL